MPSGVASAVAAVLRETAAGCEVLLIKRAERQGDPWSGHMAFPGGRHEASDQDLLATAIRETREEIGLALDHAELIGVLADHDTALHRSAPPMSIRPFIFALSQDRAHADALVLNHEVSEIVWAPLLPLLHNSIQTTKSVVHEGVPLELPAWNVSGRIVWGLTYWMLARLLGEIRGSAQTKGADP